MLKEKIYQRICLLLALMLIVLVGLCSFEKTKGYLNQHLRIMVKTLFPQSWNFYASDIHEARYDLYSISSNKELIKITGKKGGIEGRFGLSRRARRIDIDITFLIYVLKEAEWSPFSCSNRNIATCLKKEEENLNVFNVNSKKFDFIPRGRYILVKYFSPLKEEFSDDLFDEVSVISLDIE